MYFVNKIEYNLIKDNMYSHDGDSMAHDNSIDNLIINIIKEREIAEQSHLQDYLQRKGYEIPQATLSRRLKKLNIAKVAGIYRMVGLNALALPQILHIQISDHGLIVLQTHPGHAGSLAFYLDQTYVTYHPQQPKNSKILGTIAGDDTVLLITQGISSVEKVLELLYKDFVYLKPCL